MRRSTTGLGLIGVLVGLLLGSHLGSPAAGQAYAALPRQDLEKKLSELLKYIHLVKLPDGQGGMVPTIRFEGVNVQIVSGQGATNGNPASPYATSGPSTSTNGAGNLIVGYHEPPLFGGAPRTGSHNISVGLAHSYRSFGGVVVGSDNTIDGPYAAVSGGLNNTASGLAASVSGGRLNVASGASASVSGGSNNRASAGNASVTGGSNNEASAGTATVSGGFNNHASGVRAAISGGESNLASGIATSISGGESNLATQLFGTISGGHGVTVTGAYDWAAGACFFCEQ